MALLKSVSEIIIMKNIHIQYHKRFKAFKKTRTIKKGKTKKYVSFSDLTSFFCLWIPRGNVYIIHQQSENLTGITVLGTDIM